MFSVKSAYKVCRRKFLLKQNSSSGSADSGEDLWKRIWKMDCPNKVKHFLWRAAHNSHPLRSNLEYRGMDIDNRCVICNEKGEDGGHLFFKCNRVRSIWAVMDKSLCCFVGLVCFLWGCWLLLPQGLLPQGLLAIAATRTTSLTG